MRMMEDTGAAAATPTAGHSKPSMTYVHADTTNFREVVQRLTGPSRNDDHEGGGPPASAKGVVGVKRPAFKLHERRQCARTKLEIVKPPLPDYLQHCNLFPSPTSNGSGSGGASFPSPLGTPSSIFSRLSILAEDEEEEVEEEEEEEEEEVGLGAVLNKEEEEKAIRERRFYLHPSPRSKPGFTEPELLTLFPLTSPKTSDGS